MKVKAEVPDPPAKVAVPPLLRESVGVPVTVTASLIATVRVTVDPVPTVPLPLVIDAPDVAIEATVGATVSMRRVPAGL